MDDVLGPVFAAARVDWPSHIARLTNFWSGNCSAKEVTPAATIERLRAIFTDRQEAAQRGENEAAAPSEPPRPTA